MKRYLADASTLIALGACGRLHVLHSIAGTVHAPEAVLDEALTDLPGSASIQQALTDGWLTRIAARAKVARLGPGEAAIIATATAEDVLILDDRQARLEAQSRGLRVTGLIGLLVHGRRRGLISGIEALATLDALAQGNFRMTAALYQWARDELES